MRKPSIAFAKADAAGAGNKPADGTTTVPEGAAPAPAADGPITSQLAKAGPGFNFGGVGTEVPLAGGVVFKVKSQLTRNVLPQRDGETIFVKITGPIFQGRVLEGAKKKADGTPEMAPARMAEVANLKTGELGLIIANKVLEGAITEAFPGVTDTPSILPGNSTTPGAEVPTPNYVGHDLAITMKPSPESKRYKTFVVFELEAA